MSIGSRIRYFRDHYGITQKALAEEVGYDGIYSGQRIFQFEKEQRIPNKETIEALAEVLSVAPEAIDLPPIDTYLGLMHSLFAIEDLYGLTFDFEDDKVSFKIDRNKRPKVAALMDLWAQEKYYLKSEEITEDDYWDWKYNFRGQIK